MVFSPSFAFEIKQPSAGAKLPKCVAVMVEWDKFNWNTDAYDVKVTVTGGSRDANKDGVPEAVVSHVLYDQRLKEDSWYGDKPYTAYFSIPGDYISGAVDILIIARRRGGGSWPEQSRRATACIIGEHIVPPPSTKAYVFCSAIQNYKIEINPTNSALYTIKWWSHPTDTLPKSFLLEGNEYIRNYPEGLTTMYVQQVDKTGCSNPSLRVPVVVYVLPLSLLNSIPKLSNTVELQPDPDPRMNIPKCTRVGTYYDLITAPPLLPTEPPLPSGVRLKFGEPTISWEDRTYYGSAGTPNRVCNSHLPNVQGGERLYKAKLTFKIAMHIDEVDALGGRENLAYAEAFCDVKDVMETRVYKSRDCLSNIADATNPVDGVYKDHLQACNKSAELVTDMCPGASAEIGPTDEDYPPFPTTPDPRLQPKYEYKWSPAQGLSSATVRNPVLTTNNMPVSAGQYQQYKCAVKTITPFIRMGTTVPSSLFGVLDTTSTTETYCVYTYKCPDCGQQRLQPENDEEAVNSEEVELPNDSVVDKKQFDAKFAISNLILYPNPVNDQLTIRYEGMLTTVGKVVLSNLLGQTIKSWQIGQNQSEHQVSIADIPSGSYIYTMYAENQQPVSKRLIINH